MLTSDLSIDEYNSYFQPYIDNMARTELWEAFLDCQGVMEALVGHLDENKLLYRYADGKWSIKEVILHMIDTERIFSYRAMRIARSDKTPLAGFDENLFVEASGADARSIASLMAEYSAVRTGTIALLKNLTPAMFTQVGMVNNHYVSVRAIAFIILGHEKHHLRIIKERYL